MIRRIISVLLVLCLACAFCGCVAEEAIPQQDEELKGNITLVGNGQEKTLTYDEILAMPAYEAFAFGVSTVGIKFGPYEIRGVPLIELMEEVGGINQGDQIWISAPDGYMWVLDYDQINGQGFITMDSDLKEVPAPDLKLVLMYHQDGLPLTYNEGAPFRLVVSSETDDVITEASSWVKWIDKMEIKPGTEDEA